MDRTLLKAKSNFFKLNNRPAYSRNTHQQITLQISWLELFISTAVILQILLRSADNFCKREMVYLPTPTS